MRATELGKYKKKEGILKQGKGKINQENDDDAFLCKRREEKSRCGPVGINTEGPMLNGVGWVEGIGGSVGKYLYTSAAVAGRRRMRMKERCDALKECCGCG